MTTIPEESSPVPRKMALDLWDAKKLHRREDDALPSRTTKHSGPSSRSCSSTPSGHRSWPQQVPKAELLHLGCQRYRERHSLPAATAAARFGRYRGSGMEPQGRKHLLPRAVRTGVRHRMGPEAPRSAVLDMETTTASPSCAIAWDPNNSTEAHDIATPDDNTPRYPPLGSEELECAPEKTLQGHEPGVLSLSRGVSQDPEPVALVPGRITAHWSGTLSAGALFGEFPEVTNWTFFDSLQP